MRLHSIGAAMRQYGWTIINRAQASPLVHVRTRAPLLRALGLEIDRNAGVAEGVYIGGRNLRMAKDSFINVGAFIDGCDSVVLGEGVRVGPYARILTGSHQYHNSVLRRRVSEPVVAAGVRIERGAWIGMGTTILPGVTVAEGCIVGAGAVVVSDTQPNGLYLGVPAKRVKDLPIDEDEPAEF